MNEAGNNPQITLAAVPYFWDKQKYQDFYRQVAQSPVDIVYLGETVCSKRRTMKPADWLETAKQLSDAGKQVVLSTMTLLEAESELKAMEQIVKQQDYLIEANDLAAVHLSLKYQRPFAAGNALNIYNNQTLEKLHQDGMQSWCVGVELGKEDLLPMAAFAHKLGIKVEYQIFGRMPLAYSARCFTARHYQLPKDDCQFKCLDHEQGIKITTQENDPFAQINGIQTQSARVVDLIPHWQSLYAHGVNRFRIVPVSPADTLHAIDYLNRLLHHEQAQSPQYRSDYTFCNGYWFQQEGMAFNSR